MQKLYLAYALYDDKIPFKFEVREIPIKSIHKDGTIETDWPCFYGIADYTNYINGSSEIRTETEYASGNSFVYYSESCEKCMRYLVDKRNGLFDKYESMLASAHELHKKLMDSTIQKNIQDELPAGGKQYSLWLSGFIATGNSARASYEGEFEGISFDDACDNWAKTAVEPEYYTPGTDKHRPKYWACKFFDNERDARKSFG